MCRNYISPVIDVTELVAEAFCQSIEQYQIGGDTYDDDSD